MLLSRLNLKNTGDALSQISQVSIQFRGVTYPQAIYNLRTEGTSTNNDLFKAFTDYTTFSDGLRDRNGSLMNWSEWQTQQIYIFKTRQTLNNVSGNCYVTINMTGNVTVPTSILVLGLYDEYLTLTFDELARITALKKESSA